MIRQVRSRVLFPLLMLGMALNVCAQSPHPEQPHAKFSVDPSEEGALYGTGIWDTPFTFIADVSDVSHYEIDFGDDTVVACDMRGAMRCDEVANAKCTRLEGSDHVVRCVHRYKRWDNYATKLTAIRDSDQGAQIVLPLDIKLKLAPEPTPARVGFSARLSKEIHTDVEFPEADYTFTAYMDDAESYELDFGDKDDPDNRRLNTDPASIEPESEDRGIRHVYKRPGSYTAAVKAWSNAGDEVKNELTVVVREFTEPTVPPPKAKPIVEQPVVVTLPPPPRTWNWLWGLLLMLAALAVLVGTFVVPTVGPMPPPVPVPTGSPDVTFNTRVGWGRTQVVGSAKPDRAISMRLHAGPMQLNIAERVVVAQNNGEQR